MSILNKLFQPKTLEIYAPCDGELILQKDIPDEVFAEGHMGMGLGIKPTSEEVVSPFKGKLVVLFKTKHAYIIKEEVTGIAVFLHLGVDTVNIPIEKNAFTTDLKQDDYVDAKGSLCKMDLGVIREGAPSDVAVLLIQPDNMEGKQITFHKKTGSVVKGDLLMTIIPK